MTGVQPRLVLHGDSEHGVARYARDLAHAVGPALGTDPVDVTQLDDLPDHSTLHIQFTDRLWGSSPADAARRVGDLTWRHTVVLTLHDLPQPSDGSGLARRAECYEAVCRGARAVVVNSEHERALLAAHVDPALTAYVIPLPVDARAQPVRPRADQVVDDIAVLGYFYPGKGHAEAVAAATALGIPRVTVLGRASPGHERELDDLVQRSALGGVDVEVTGFLPDADLLERCRVSGVPLVAHRHLSASGSLTTWLSVGRRPVALEGRYTREMVDLRPGSLNLSTVDGLVAAVGDARADPGSTWLPTGRPLPWDSRDAAAAYLRLWRTR